jgi:predicted metal-dependent hydrolase
MRPVGKNECKGSIVRLNWLMKTILIGLTTSVVDAAPPKSVTSESLRNFLKKEAQRLFALSDATEQKDAEQRASKAFSSFVEKRELAGPRIPPKVDEPTIVDPDQVTEEEFVQIFQAKAAKHDAEVRARRIAKKEMQIQHELALKMAASQNSPVRESKAQREDRLDALRYRKEK